jgi:hypothetical protein
MADIKGLLGDPHFQQLDLATQRQVLGRVDPAFSNLSNDQLTEFRSKVGSSQPSQQTTPQPQPDPGFFGELYNQNIAPLVQLGNQHAQAQLPDDASWWDHIKSAAGEAMMSPVHGAQTAWDLVKGAFSAQAQQGAQTWQALTGQGEFQGMSPMERASSGLGHGLAAALPVLGPMAARAGENFGSGRTGAGAADVVSLGAQMFGPEIGEAAAGPIRSAAEGLYRKGLPLKRSLSLDEMHGATRYGLEEGLPNSEASVNRLGSVDDPHTILGGLETQIQDQLAQLGRGSKQIDLATATKPLRDAIAKASHDTTTEGKAYAQTLRDELNSWTTSNQSLTVQQAHMAKRSMYDRISASQYADNSSGIPSADLTVKEELARGLKDAVNEKVPEVAELNNRFSTAIDLKNALTDAAKSNPSSFRNQLTWALGGSSVTALSLGHEAAGVGGLIATAAKLAIDNPASASRIAIAFQRSPRVLRALGYGMQGAAITSQLDNPNNQYQGTSNGVPVYQAPSAQWPSQLVR